MTRHITTNSVRAIQRSRRLKEILGQNRPSRARTSFILLRRQGLHKVYSTVHIRYLNCRLLFFRIPFYMFTCLSSFSFHSPRLYCLIPTVSPQCFPPPASLLAELCFASVPLGSCNLKRMSYNLLLYSVFTVNISIHSFQYIRFTCAISVIVQCVLV